MAYQCVMRLLRFARNDNAGVLQRSPIAFANHLLDLHPFLHLCIFIIFIQSSAGLYALVGQAGGANGMLLTRLFIVIHALLGFPFFLINKRQRLGFLKDDIGSS